MAADRGRLMERLGRASVALGVIAMVGCADRQVSRNLTHGSEPQLLPDGRFRAGPKIYASKDAFLDDDVLCATPEVVGDQAAQIEAGLKESLDQQTVAIPVHVHVLKDATGLGELSAKIIEDQIAILNAAFDGSTGGARTRFRFTLAGVNPRTEPDWFSMTKGSPAERAAKDELRIGDQRTLNIFTAEPADGKVAWATFPWDYVGAPGLDGIVVRHDTLPGGGYTPWNAGDTLVHEVGHWLGLYHTFRSGCSNLNDEVSDTPAEAGHAKSCAARDSCPAMAGMDPITNFMDYGDDSCRSEFTSDQSSRFDRMWVTHRR